MKMHRSTLTRRRFIKTSTAVAAGLLLPAWYLEELRGHAAETKPRSANDKPGLALIGTGSRGKSLLKEAEKFGNITAICDVDQEHLLEVAKLYPAAVAYKDFRKLLKRSDVDAVLIATPDHWHALVAIAAMRAGKDVYCEKPMTHTIEQGQRLIKVVEETKRVFQVGSQQRSDARFRLACELVRNNRLGKLKHVITGLPPGIHGGPLKPGPVPQGVDWNLWLGPAPMIEYVSERHRAFRHFYDYSGGRMTDWGPHHIDIALWAMGLENSGPISADGKAHLKPISGGFEIPSQYSVDFTYANGITHLCRSVADEKKPDDQPDPVFPTDMVNGIKFEGSEGTLLVTRKKIEASKSEIIDAPLPSNAVRLEVSANHMGNFVECMRTRKKPIAPVEHGHRSVSACHIGVIAIRLGRKLQWDPVKEQFIGDKEASALIAREMRKPWTYEAV